MSDSDQLWVAKEAFFAAELDIMVNKGELVRDGHPLLRGREALFDPATRRVAYDVEQATAAPGEKRGRGGRRGRREEPNGDGATESPQGTDETNADGDEQASAADVSPEAAVEQATAAPGEKRG